MNASGKSFICGLSDRANDGTILNKSNQTPLEKERKHHAIKCGCQWVVRWKLHINMNYTGEDTLIRLTYVNMIHTPPCNPSPSQFSQVLR